MHREASLPQSHGLTAVGWGEILSQGLDHLPSIGVRAEGGGTLSQLIKLQKQRTWMFQNLSGSSNLLPFGLGSLEWSNNFIVTLDALLSRSPELASIYWSTTGKSPNLRNAQFALDIPDLSDYDKMGKLAQLAISRVNNEEVEEIKRVFKLPPLKTTSSDQMFCGRRLNIVSDVCILKSKM